MKPNRIFRSLLPSARVFRAAATLLVLAALALPAAWAQQNPFAPGWTLDSQASTIRFQSIKKQTKVESSTFATFEGAVDTNGLATVKVLLDSVDTKIDLRNVRMRFLFFETFQYPEATITVQLTPDVMEGLESSRRKLVTLPMTMGLHGVEATLDVELALTWIGDGVVSVSSAAPLAISVTDFNLLSGLKKLEEAANVDIVPTATVTFDLLFSRDGGDAPATQVAQAAPAAPASAALEAEGDFSAEACIGRFEILSRTDNIYFKFASAELDPKSRAILDTIVDIIRRCPGMVIEVSGHTDSDGSEATNQALSEARANSVKAYFVGSGIEGTRIQTRGYGESQPAFPNDSAENKRRNRRIEFAVVQ